MISRNTFEIIISVLKVDSNPTYSPALTLMREKLRKFEESLGALEEKLYQLNDNPNIRLKDIKAFRTASVSLQMVLNGTIKDYLRKDLADLDDQAKQRFLQEIDQNTRILEQTINLFTTLAFEVDTLKKDKEYIDSYIINCKEILGNESDARTKNFFKAIMTIAIVASDALIGAFIGSIFLTLVSPIVVASQFNDGFNASTHVTSKKAAMISFGVLVGALLSPFIGLLSIFPCGILGASIGYKSSKDWNKMADRESILRFCLFKKPILSSTIEKITQHADALRDQIQPI